MPRFLIILSIFYLVFTFYGFQAIKTIFKSQWVNIAYITLFALAMGYFIFKMLTYIPGSAMLEDIYRIGVYIVNKLFGSRAVVETNLMPSRRKFISSIALGLASLPFGALLYGMYKGKYNYKVLKYTLEYDDLPDAFNGYQITQISDVHSGSFDNAEKVAYGIDLINKQKSDMLLFTGDMVNNEATEMKPYADIFSKLEAKDGKFSVLGNHDYGDYKQWHEEKAQNDRLKEENLNDLKKLQKDIGFDLLLNESRFIEKDGERIALVGVENWGKGGYES